MTLEDMRRLRQVVFYRTALKRASGLGNPKPCGVGVVVLDSLYDGDLGHRKSKPNIIPVVISGLGFRGLGCLAKHNPSKPLHYQGSISCCLLFSICMSIVGDFMHPCISLDLPTYHA